MADLATLKFPQNSHRKKVVLPKHSTMLAEFFGIMIGDGGINNPWQANITLNSIKDKEYSKYVYNICNKLFRVFPAIRQRKNKNALIVSLAGTSIVDFLVDNGLIRGNKLKNGLKIPDWILTKKAYKVACVRGLVDTDGCIFVHTHKISGKEYRNISLSFASYSPKLISQVLDILAEFGILGHISKKGKEISLYQEGDIKRYLEIFGTSNDRIKSVYNKWRDARVV